MPHIPRAAREWAARPGHHRVRSAGSPPSGASAEVGEAPKWRSDQADSSERPLRRRAARIARPARVRIRWRKPWVRLRRRRLGWNVRLVTGGLPLSSRSDRFEGVVPTHRSQSAEARSAERRVNGDLLTVRGTAKAVKPREAADCAETVAGRPADTPHDQPLLAIGLHEGPRVASVAVRLTLHFAWSVRVRPNRPLVHGRRSPPALADRRNICAQLWITMWRVGQQDPQVDARHPPRGWAAAEPDSLPRAGRRHRICMENE